MTTLGDVFAEFEPLVSMYMVEGDNGLPMLRCEFDILPSDTAISLPQGPDGDSGPDGEPGPPMSFRDFITSDAVLPSIAATLGARDVGATWANEVNSNIHYWTGTSWLTLDGALSVAGPAGPASNLTLGTVTSSAPDGYAAVTVTGTPPNQLVNVTLPRGVTGPTGPQGPAGAIASSTDYDGSTPAVDGDVIYWDATANKFKPRALPRPGAGTNGVFSIVNASFSTSTISGGSGTVATINIPNTIPYDYRILGFGCFKVNASGGSDQIRATVQTAGGQVVAQAVRAIGSGTRPVTLVPYSSTALTTGSTAGVLPKLTAQTMSVVLTRDSGSSSYNVVSDSNVNSVMLLIVPTT
ncbi:MAG: hypothetical protein LLG14_20475 [Nocardiaceae bacterium]|nr:hypothetical protein [Nocardiaceae bacterium]